MLDSVRHPEILDSRFHGNDNMGAGMTHKIILTISGSFRERLSPIPAISHEFDDAPVGAITVESQRV